MTLSLAESCTGGLVSDRITNVAGCSDYFEGGIVSYSVGAKAKHLGIPIKYIERYGDVSPQVAKRMADGVRKAFKTNFGLSTTGVAGPTGGTKRTPVGTVFIAVADGRRTFVKKLQLKGSRREIKEKAAKQALRFLYKKLAHATQDSTYSIQVQGSRIQHPILQWLNQSKASEIVMVRKAPKGISKQKGRLGIFPASFNPPTPAHVALIREAIKKERLDEVLVLLDIQAMDKEPVGATFEDRLAMLKKVFGKDPKISVGLSNQGLFLEKLKPLRALYPTSIELVFIVGFDTILRVMDKKYYRNRKRSLDELFEQSRFLVANRDRYEGTAFEMLFRRRVNKRYAGRVAFFTLPKRFSILSSTIVREKIAKGLSVVQLVPASILQFIKKKRPYDEK